MVNRKSRWQKFFGEDDEITETDKLRKMLSQLEHWILQEDYDLINAHWKMIQSEVNKNVNHSNKFVKDDKEN